MDPVDSGQDQGLSGESGLLGGWGLAGDVAGFSCRDQDGPLDQKSFVDNVLWPPLLDRPLPLCDWRPLELESRDDVGPWDEELGLSSDRLEGLGDQKSSADMGPPGAEGGSGWMGLDQKLSLEVGSAVLLSWETLDQKSSSGTGLVSGELPVYQPLAWAASAASSEALFHLSEL